MNQQVDVFVDAAAIFIGNFVRSQKRGHITQAVFGIEPADDAQHLQFGVERQAVAGLGFDGGSASAQEPLAIAARGSGQILLAGFASAANGGADAATAGGDLGIGDSLDALLEFGGTIAGEDGMSVSVDESGEHDAPAGIDDGGVVGGYALRSRRGNRPRRCGHRAPAWRHRG